jgi:polysaccharide export outer membrane protein
MESSRKLGGLWGLGAVCVFLLAAGCSAPCKPPPADIPRELNKVNHPTYVVEPPDILLINALRVVPKPPYRIAPLDTLIIQASNVLPDEPLNGPVTVEPDGMISLGLSYGSFRVVDLTLPEAREVVERTLKERFKNVSVRITLGSLAAVQQIQGDHIVRPDGTIGLGTYGSVNVAGMTLDEVKAVVEKKLSNKLLKPEVSVDIFAYNSKFYYIISDGGGFGEQVLRLPCTGNETVLDAFSQIGGLSIVASKNHIWLARPSPADKDCMQVLPVDWKAITRGADTATNYQLLPGDRIFVQAQRIITIDTALARFISPFERIFGVTILGSSTIHDVAIPLGAGAAISGGGGVGR